MINYNEPLNIIPENDVLRLDKLYQFEILNTAPEPGFDVIAQLAAEIFETEHAYISFVDKETIFTKASISEAAKEKVSRADSLCALSILKDEVTVYDDTYKFHDLLDSPFFSGYEDIRFYAAAPIVTTEGFVLGIIYVTDSQPRAKVTDRQVKMLQMLAGMVMEKLEKRLIINKMTEAYDSRMHRLVHDMKNPITSISLYAQLLGNREMSAEKVFSMAAKIEKSTKVIEKNLDSLLTNN